MAGSERRPLEQREDDAAQAEDGEGRAGPIDPRRARRVAALVDETQRQRERDQGEGKVQKEHRAPADVFDQPAAADRTDRGRDRAEARPRADRAASFGLVEGGADDRQAAGHEEGGAHALHGAAGNQHRRRGRHAAGHGGEGEEDQAGEEDPLAAELIAERSADQDEGAEKQRVRFDHPLHVGDRGVKVGLKRGQRHVHDRAVDERHARREDRGHQRPPSRRRHRECGGEEGDRAKRSRAKFGGVSGTIFGTGSSGRLSMCGFKSGARSRLYGSSAGRASVARRRPFCPGMSH